MQNNYFNIWKTAWDFQKECIGKSPGEIIDRARQITDGNKDHFLADLIVAVLEEFMRRCKDE